MRKKFPAHFGCGIFKKKTHICLLRADRVFPAHLGGSHCFIMYVVYATLFSYLWLLLLADVVATSIETYKIDEFPQDKIALHFGCVESDMFATNCACHITCKNNKCDNAIDICTKYSNLGCKYLLFRNIGQKKV